MRHPRSGKIHPWLIAYDVSSSKRLRKIAGLCENYGTRLEKSFFICHLSGEEFEGFWRCVVDMALAEEDVLFACPLCSKCFKEIYSFGNIGNIRPSMWYIV